MKISLRKIAVNLPHGEQVLFRLPSFDVESGQRLLIQGQSGKGKTTLLHLIAGLFVPDEGQVEIGVARVSDWGDEARCRFRREHIALIFQKLNLLEHLTPLENVLLSLGREADAVERARAALTSVGLIEAMAKRSSVLSLGEQQRVAVARALASKAQIVLADEPTSSLDAENADNVMDLLFTAAHGKTLIVVSHDARITSRFDRVVRFEELVRR